MIVTVLFVALVAVALVGAGGLLFYRRVTQCCVSFLVCCLALGGLYLLLGTGFLATVHLLLSVGMAGAALAVCIPVLADGIPVRRTPWLVAAGVPLLAAVSWGIASGTIGEPMHSSPPLWTVRGGHLPALGVELVSRYSVPFALLGLLLLAGLVSIAHLARQDDRLSRTGREE